MTVSAHAPEIAFDENREMVNTGILAILVATIFTSIFYIPDLALKGAIFFTSLYFGFVMMGLELELEPRTKKGLAASGIAVAIISTLAATYHHLGTGGTVLAGAFILGAGLIAIGWTGKRGTG